MKNDFWKQSDEIRIFWDVKETGLIVAKEGAHYVSWILSIVNNKRCADVIDGDLGEAVSASLKWKVNPFSLDGLIRKRCDSAGVNVTWIGTETKCNGIYCRFRGLIDNQFSPMGQGLAQNCR